MDPDERKRHTTDLSAGEDASDPDAAREGEPRNEQADATYTPVEAATA
jgi:hypothetical protein